MEADRDGMLGQLARDRDSILAQSNAEKERLLHELAAVQRDRDEQMMEAENQRLEVWAENYSVLQCL